MDSAAKSSIWARLAWFVAIWAGSVAALGLVALAIRWILRA
jgi:hypothetical protein